MFLTTALLPPSECLLISIFSDCTHYAICMNTYKTLVGSTEVEILNDGQIAVFKERGLKYLLHVGGQNFEILGELFGFFQNHLKTLQSYTGREAA